MSMLRSKTSRPPPVRLIRKVRAELLKAIGGTDNFTVRVTPKASANKIKLEKGADGASLIRVYVTCVPEDGKANKAVIELLAKMLGIPKTALSVIRGETSREKTIHMGVRPENP